jgi:hypothetical protein
LLLDPPCFLVAMVRFSSVLVVVVVMMEGDAHHEGSRRVNTYSDMICWRLLL